MAALHKTDVAQNNSKIFYGWVIVAAAMCIYAVGAGQGLSFGIFVKPMAGELGWSRGAITGAFGLYAVSMAAFSFICGVLVDRIGPRILNVIGGIAMGLGFYLSSRVSTLWQFYLSYSLLGGIGFSCMFITINATIPRWFIDKKGLALGLFFAGGGVGGMILSPLLQSWIKLYGWRTAFVILAILACSIIIPAALFLRKEPGDMGLMPLGKTREVADPGRVDEPDTGVQEIPKDYTVSDALKTGSFWMFSAAWVLMYIGIFMGSINMVPHATDRGITAATAAFALGLSAVINSIGRLVIGAVSDKIGTKSSFFICMVLGIISLFWLISVREPWMIFLFIIPFGIAYGGVLPLKARGVSEMYGVKSMGGILGILTSITALGPAIGPALGGFIYDRTGSYNLAFIIGGVSILMGLILVKLIDFSKK
jgi:OFA family oxalate/formate antiporter-like MFS transporter